ncbi:MAG: BlaI/MecI/CopY family transcriptional regulator [Bryobacterales bacterium]|nr:BlaI/MecI/CopY family transcriptional regulator [Acidobacteriota bacterium]MCB9383393.1 BlaI/MecI/CopY family transcriptional regulator [Bryobacterales bacterium]
MTATPSVRRTRPLPELELEVMKILWSLADATVAEVQEQLNSFRPLAYTTVMTVLDRLTRKHVATRRKRGRGYVYRPALSREVARELALERLLNDYFADSPDNLVAYVRRRGSFPGSEARVEHQLDSSLL